jgi:hypothetical protein
MPDVSAEFGRYLLARDQIDRCARLAPLGDAPLRDGHPPRRMDWLHPTGLLGFGIDPVLADQIEQIAGTLAEQSHEPLAGLTVSRDDRLWILSRQRRNDLPIVAAGRAPAGRCRIDDQDLLPGLRQMQRGGQAREARSDHEHVGLEHAL